MSWRLSIPSQPRTAPSLKARRSFLRAARSPRKRENILLPSVDALPLPSSNLRVDDGLALPNSNAIALGQSPQTPPPLILLALPPFLLVGEALGEENVQLGRRVVLDSVATATLDVETLKRWAGGGPRLSWGGVREGKGKRREERDRERLKRGEGAAEEEGRRVSARGLGVGSYPWQGVENHQQRDDPDSNL
jgi:hypothetical protein